MLPLHPFILQRVVVAIIAAIINPGSDDIVSQREERSVFINPMASVCYIYFSGNQPTIHFPHDLEYLQ